jgi:hypothetical protein
VEISAENPSKNGREASAERTFHGLNNGLCNLSQPLFFQRFGLFRADPAESSTRADAPFSTAGRVTAV